ncbi:MAG: biotin carboxylase N-terminal domain-containing protein [Bacteroidales bacterium]|nr:biotin carboxylase N-terminal domain-containing protein [Bacteroidales bacterium]
MGQKTYNINHINKVLVANRGEIAIRIFESLHQMGICTVAVYSETDAGAPHSRIAAERYLLKGNKLSDTYLNIEQLVNIALKSDADAIHPGYGFLSENPDFAKAVTEAGLTFIGPSEEAIRLMGNKKQAREIAADLGIPVIEGATGDINELLKKSGELGYPVLVKAAAGGGGKGMRIAGNEHELHEVLETTQREALNYFGNGDVYIEKYLPSPRHIEVQILADQQGNVLSLFERECSLQRRHQKIIEEAPAPNISSRLRKDITAAAKKLAEHINYHSAGTVEFLVQEDSFFFLEMNTRIQVEHPVTEMITGLDLVKEQVHIATGRPLPYRQHEISMNGHAIEARIYAEDPDNGFLPSPGKVLLNIPPEGKRLRIDSSLDGPGEISSMFDPMVSKLIFHANSRETARKKIIQHLKDYVIIGVKTNISFLIDVLSSEAFAGGNIHTRLIENTKLTRSTSHTTKNYRQFLAMAYQFIYTGNATQPGNTWKHIGHWRLLPDAQLQVDGESITQGYNYHTPYEMSIVENGQHRVFRLLHKDEHSMHIEVDGTKHALYYLAINGEVMFQYEGVTSKVNPQKHLGRDALTEINENPELEGESLVRAPMHGTVIKVFVNAGDAVNKGDTLLILESMKMENKITSTAKAYVKKVDVSAGDMVANNTLLVHLSNKLV